MVARVLGLIAPEALKVDNINNYFNTISLHTTITRSRYSNARSVELTFMFATQVSHREAVTLLVQGSSMEEWTTHDLHANHSMYMAEQQSNMAEQQSNMAEQQSNSYS